MKNTGKAPTYYRTIWISDIHLGTHGARCNELNCFLRTTRSEKLYLVGDIFDGWQLKKRWYWPQNHNIIIQRLLRKAKAGTKILYIPGNHDEIIRQFAGAKWGNVEIHLDCVHTTATGKKLLVVHGDMFDNVIQHARWLAYLGDQAYVILLKTNQLVNAIRQIFNLPYWSFSQYLKHKVKSAVSFMSAFEKAMETEARRRGCIGVICGHIHKPQLATNGDFIYANDGDWVESMTALVEHVDGTLEIIDWSRKTIATFDHEPETQTANPTT